MVKVNTKLIERGLRAADSQIFKEDKIWSKYSNDKVDIGEHLARVIRTLSKALPLHKDLRALSIGSSNEPQFRILETNFRGGLYLLDLEEAALDIVKERIKRQSTKHVKLIRGDYNKAFLLSKNALSFLKNKLGAKKINLITLHHSLYYCPESGWHDIFRNLYKYILASEGAMHAVLMASKTNNPYTTTWVYNHFAGKFFNHYNNQSLQVFKEELKRNPLYRGAQILSKRSCVSFFSDDFEKFMAVIWMILLYPQVHRFTLKQREHITEFTYKKFWSKRKSLLQLQDHLVVYRGIGVKGLV